ncbi:MAG: ABC transporter permease [Clostridia bacterium]|nr:ABC transporter permease [Clostridia bacterium]
MSRRGSIAQKVLMTVAILFIVAPLLMPIIYSFSTVWYDLLPEGMTVKWYHKLISDPRYRSGAMVSLSVALLAVTVDVALCVPAAYSLNRLMQRGSRSEEIISQLAQVLPLVIPPLVIGVALLQGFSRAPLALTGTIWMVIIAHALIGFPFMLRNVLVTFQTIDEVTLSEAAQSLGANTWQRFRYVLVPNVLPGIVSGALLVFSISIGEFEVTSMVAGFGWNTLPLLLFRSLMDDIRMASAISAVLVYISLAAFAGIIFLSRRVYHVRSGLRQ